MLTDLQNVLRGNLLHQRANYECMLPCFFCAYAHQLNPPFPRASSSEQVVDILRHKV